MEQGDVSLSGLLGNPSQPIQRSGSDVEDGIGEELVNGLFDLRLAFDGMDFAVPREGLMSLALQMGRKRWSYGTVHSGEENSHLVDFGPKETGYNREMPVTLKSDFPVTHEACKQATGKTLDERAEVIANNSEVATKRREAIQFVADTTGRSVEGIWWATKI